MLRSVLSARLARRFGAWLGVGSVILIGLPTTPVQAATTGPSSTYLVVYKEGASSQDAQTVVQGAGGSLVYNYDQIGVAVAKSNHSDFTSKVLSASRVDVVAPTSKGVTRLRQTEPDENG